jgi:hypothetical protein
MLRRPRIDAHRLAIAKHCLLERLEVVSEFGASEPGYLSTKRDLFALDIFVRNSFVAKELCETHLRTQ